MKKGLLALSAFVFTLALAGCGAEKEKASDKESSSSAAETTAAEITTAAEASTDAEKEKDTKDEVSGDKDEKSDNSSSAADLTLKDIAGPYHKTGYMAMGNYPDELNPKTLSKEMKDDPMTISEDGTLHFCGRDYKLTLAGKKDEETVFSIDGSGFDMEKYVKSSACGSKDYEGPCMFVYNIQHATLNDEDYPYAEYRVILKAQGSDSSFGYISVDQGEESNDGWDWEWDDDKDTTAEE